MTALGIAVGYPAAAKGRPVVSCVVLEGSRTNTATVVGFDLRTSADDLVEQLVDLAKSLSSKLSGLSVTTVVIRIADRPPVASRAAAPHKRLLTEGALAFVCRERVENVIVRNGRELGVDLALTKAEAVAAGARLDSARPDAAAAALVALPA